MAVVVVGLNHRTVPLELLERMTVSDAYLPKAVHDLLGREHLTEAVVLSTCMRTEIYAVAGRFHGAMVDVRNLLAQGYVPVLGNDGHTVYLVQSARSVRGGVAFTF